jgi:uncharacterized protein YwqG
LKLYSPEEFEKLVFLKCSWTLKPNVVKEWKQYHVMLNRYEFGNLDEELVKKGERSLFPPNLPENQRKDFYSHIREGMITTNNEESPNLGSFPQFVQGDETPEGFQLLVNFNGGDDKSEPMWGDSGTCQLWVKSEGDNVKLEATWSCY